MTASPSDIARRALSRTVLVGTIVFASLGAAASLLYGALAQTGELLASSSTITVATPLETVPDLPLPDYAQAQYTMVDIAVAPEMNEALPLQQAATLLPFIVAGLTCLLIVLLAAQLLRRRPFGIASGISMLAVGTVAIASGFAVPALQSRAELALVESLGLPTDGYQAATWVAPSHYSWEFSDWPLILLGLLTLLGGWLVLRARQLRLDLEGTI